MMFEPYYKYFKTTYLQYFNKLFCHHKTRSKYYIKSYDGSMCFKMFITIFPSISIILDHAILSDLEIQICRKGDDELTMGV